MRYLLNLKSRRGEGYLLLTVLLLGFSFVILSMALDGLSLAIAYRRAQGLASVGAQAGASTIAPFDGQSVALASNACEVALATIQASLPTDANPNVITSTCNHGKDSLSVVVALTPQRFFAGPLMLPIDTVRAQVSATAKYGIHLPEN